MRQDASYFEDHDPILIYIAKRLNDALRLESILTEAGLDYGVEADQYIGGFLFKRERTGAFFYVLPDMLEATRRVMLNSGYRPYEEDR
jgi:hypothetical protein